MLLLDAVSGKAQVAAEFQDRILSNAVAVAPQRWVFAGMSGALYLLAESGKILRQTLPLGELSHWSEPWLSADGRIWTGAIEVSTQKGSRVILEIRDSSLARAHRAEWEGTGVESPWGALPDGTVLVSSRRAGFSGPELRWVSPSGAVLSRLELPCLPKKPVIAGAVDRVAFVCDLSAKIYFIELATKKLRGPIPTLLNWSSWEPAGSA